MSRAVIDQPGLRIIICGLITALIMGLILKAQISPARVQGHLQKAVSRLEKDFFVDFEASKVNLSNWGLPWPRLEIYRVRLSPKKNICQSSQMYIDQIEIPLSWTSLLLTQSAVDTIRARQVELRIGDLKDCFDNPKESQNIDQTQAPNLAANPEANLFQRRTSTQLKHIHIEQLKVIVKGQVQQPFILRQLNFDLNYEREKLSQIHIRSRLHALNDPKADVYYFVGQVMGDISALEQNAFEANLKISGRMLDGDLQLQTQYNSQANKLTYTMAARKVSVKAFLPIVKLNGYETVFNNWPVSASFEIYGQSLLHSDPLSEVKVQNLHLTGDRTDIRSDLIEFVVKNNQADAKAFKLQIEQLPLSYLKNIKSLRNELNSFEDLGLLKAEVQFADEKHWQVSGQLQNTLLIFSNRGTREIQRIDSIQFRSKHNFYNHELFLSDFKINNSVVDGQLEAKYNQQNETILARMNVQGALLNPLVWRQITNVEQSANVKVNWSYQKTGDTRQQMTMSSPQILFEGIQLNDVTIDLLQAFAGTDQKSVIVKLKSQNVTVTPAELRNETALNLFTPVTGLVHESYNSRNLFLNLNGADWKSMNFDFDMSLRSAIEDKSAAQLKAKGQWENVDQIDATATLDYGPKHFKYNVTKNSQGQILLVPTP